MFACGRSSAVLWSNPSPMIAQSETYCGDQATGHTNVQHKQKAQHAPKLHNMGWLWAHRPFTSGAILSIWRHDICAEMGLRLLPLLPSAEYNGIGVRVIHICPSLRKYRQKKQLTRKRDCLSSNSGSFLLGTMGHWIHDQPAQATWLQTRRLSLLVFNGPRVQ